MFFFFSVFQYLRFSYFNFLGEKYGGILNNIKSILNQNCLFGTCVSIKVINRSIPIEIDMVTGTEFRSTFEMLN